MEFLPSKKCLLLVKVECLDPAEFQGVEKELPLVESHYDSKRRILTLCFPTLDVDSTLTAFTTLFPRAKVLETGLSVSTEHSAYVKKFSERISIVSSGRGDASTEGQILVKSLLSFGSGFHPTTDLCIRLLERAFSMQKITTVFDLGTGSGILALVAAKLGATRILASDIELAACLEARDNVISNGIGHKVHVVCGSLECARQGIFDLVVANLTISTMITLARFFPPLLTKQGLLVMSGFTQEQLGQVISALGKRQPMVKLVSEGWSGLLTRPNS